MFLRASALVSIFALIILFGCQSGPEPCDVNADIALDGCSLFGQDVSNADWSGRSVIGANLDTANMTNTNLSNANFSTGHLVLTDFSGSNMMGSNFTDAVMNDSRWIDVDATGGQFAGAHFGGAIMENVDFASAAMTNTKFSVANLVNVTFADANLERARFDGTTLVDISFENAILANVTFDDVDLSSVDFSGATLTSVNFISVTGLTTEKIKSTASWEDLQFVLISDVAIDMRAICSGESIEDNAGYDSESPYIQFVVPIFLNARGELDDIVYEQLVSNTLASWPKEWIPYRSQDTNLVLCVEDEQGETFGDVCNYEGGFEINRIQYSRQVVLRDAKTGGVIQAEKIVGSAPPSCPTSIVVGRNQGARGDKVADADIIEWVHSVLEQSDKERPPLSLD